MNKVLEATLFADERHAGQVRRGTGHKYASHPVAVSYIVAAFKRSKHLDDILCAAILHDVLEDTKTTFVELAEKFGGRVASLALELTNDDAEIKKVGKLAYHCKKLIGISSYALVIKLADRIHNISDNPTRKMVEDTQKLMTYLRENRKLSGTHSRMVDHIENACTEWMFQHEKAA